MAATQVFLLKSSQLLATYVAIAVPAASWLPEDPIGATIIGIVGGALRWSISRASLLEGLLTLATGVGTAVFGNGIEIPFLDKIVDADAHWRVNTLLLAFGGTVTLEGIILFKEKLKKEKKDD